MVINFKSVSIKNFLSFGDAFINLDTTGFTLVNGINNNPNDSAKSNGSGKSSIWEAISWCLTGETIRGTKDVANIHIDDTTEVELIFTLDTDTYRIQRTKNPSNLFVFINDENKSGKGIKDTSKLLAEYLPDLTSQLIGSVIILGQGLPQRFSNNSPSGRKEVLETLSKSDFMIEDLKQRLSERKSELADEIRHNEDEMLGLTSKKALLNTQIDESRRTLSEISSSSAIDSEIEQLNNKITECSLSIAKLQGEIQTISDEYSALNSKKSDISSSIITLNDEKSVLLTEKSDISTTLSAAKLSVESKYNPIINNFFKDYTEASSELKAKTFELNKMKNIKDTCPTCGQKLPGVFKPDTSELEKVILSLTNSANDALQAKKNAENDKERELDVASHSCDNELLRLQKDINDKDSAINSVKAEINDIDRKLNTLSISGQGKNSEIAQLNNSIEFAKSKINELSVEKESIEGKKNAAQHIIDTNSAQIVEIDEKLVYNNNVHDTLGQHSSVLTKMETVIKRDFRGVLLSNIIAYIDAKCKEYCEFVFDTDKISFKLDGNDLSISYDGKEYENLSGGEKQKIDLIVQFSLRDMLCKYLGFSSSILVLDEIFDNLDSDGCDRVLNLISKKLNDVSSVYIVTHHADLCIPCDNEITVVKDENGISSIQ